MMEVNRLFHSMLLLQCSVILRSLCKIHNFIFFSKLCVELLRVCIHTCPEF